MPEHPDAEFDRRRDAAGRRHADLARDWLQDSLIRIEAKLDDNVELITDIRLKQATYVSWDQFAPVRDLAKATDVRLKFLGAIVTILIAAATAYFTLHPR